MLKIIWHQRLWLECLTAVTKKIFKFLPKPPVSNMFMQVYFKEAIIPWETKQDPKLHIMWYTYSKNYPKLF